MGKPRQALRFPQGFGGGNKQGGKELEDDKR